MRYLPRLAVLLASAVVFAAPAAAQDFVEQCRQMAAHPDEPGNADHAGNAKLSDIPWNAAYICHEAWWMAPDSVVSHYRLGRALLAPGALQDISDGIKFLNWTWGAGSKPETIAALGAEAAEWYRSAGETANQPDTYRADAAAGDPFAQTTLALLEWNDANRAGLEAAAKSGYTHAEFTMGVAAENEGDFPAAIDWYTGAAHKGMTLAQMQLAYMTWGGKGMPADQKKATVLMTLAASAGNSKAQGQLNEWTKYADAQGLRAEDLKAEHYIAMLLALGILIDLAGPSGGGAGEASSSSEDVEQPLACPWGYWNMGDHCMMDPGIEDELFPGAF